MASVNKVILIGNLGKDPETRYAPSGDAICNITLATTDTWRDKASGEKREATEWHRLVGVEAAPTPAGVVELVPRVNHLLGRAVIHLRANGVLVEDSQMGTWAPGPTIGDIYTIGWPDGRAEYIVELLRRRGELEVEDTLPEFARRWIDGAAA